MSWCVLLDAAIAAVVLYYLLYYFLERMKLKELGRRAVFVTGCDSGFGRQLALQLTELGMPVFAGCFTPQGAANIERDGNNIAKNRLRSVPLDVTSDVSVEKAAQFVTESLRDGEYLWAFVNNAGVFATYGPDDWLTIKEYMEAINVNLLGAVRMCHAFKPLIKRCKGRIVTVASTAGRVTFPGGGPYCTSKFGIIAYMDVLRQELYPYGVSCHTLEPGIFQTSLIEEEAYHKRLHFAFDRLPQQMKIEYGHGVVEEMKGVWRKAFMARASTNTQLVVDAYVHALTSRYPRPRYVVGWDAKLLWMPFSFLPTNWQLIFMMKVLPLLTGAKMPTPDILKSRPMIGNERKVA